jgi:hypothetical protein
MHDPILCEETGEDGAMMATVSPFLKVSGKIILAPFYIGQPVYT